MNDSPRILPIQHHHHAGRLDDLERIGKRIELGHARNALRRGIVLSAGPIAPFGLAPQVAQPMPTEQPDTDATELPARFKRQIVAYNGAEAAGTVIMAMGRPDKKFRDPGNPGYEQWLYELRGLKRVFVTFEDNVVVQVKQY